MMSSSETIEKRTTQPRAEKLPWLYDLILLVIMLVGLYFRFTGVNWDANQHLHPDERFLTMVATSIEPVGTYYENGERQWGSLGDSLKEYFNTDISRLNPNNRGYNFYVYGTLPLFITRYVGEWLGQTGYDEINLVGRQLSAIADVLTVFLVYLIAKKLYNRRVALLAALFDAFAVLQIQLSHYATVDTFVNLFTFLAFYFAVCLLMARDRGGDIRRHPLTSPWFYILFGVGLGLAMASKVSSAPVAALLPAAAAIRFFQLSKEGQRKLFAPVLANLVIAAIVAFFVFRIFQPYAFTGPGFFGLNLNEKWLAALHDLQVQSTGDVDFPPALQWADRPITFAFQNLTVWGLGLPLGILAFAGFLWMAWRMIRGEWQHHALVWAWTAVYFAWQSFSFTPSMRYLLLIYPTLAIIAGWAVIRAWNEGRETKRHWLRPTVAVIGALAAVGTIAWAYAFIQIYERPMTRVAASEWIYQNVPAAINLHVETDDGMFNQPMGFRLSASITPEQPYEVVFQPKTGGTVVTLQIPFLVDHSVMGGDVRLDAEIYDSEISDVPLGTAELISPMPADTGDPRGKSYTFSFTQPVTLAANQSYRLVLRQVQGAGPIEVNGVPQLLLSEKEGNSTVYLPEASALVREGRNVPQGFENAQYPITFSAVKSGTLEEIYLPHVADWLATGENQTLTLTLEKITNAGSTPIGTGSVTGTFLAKDDPRGDGYTVKLNHPVSMEKDGVYSLAIQLKGAGAVSLYGEKGIDESSWDDALPRPLYGISTNDYYTGAYRTDLNFEMYWDDNAEKLQRFETNLDEGDYIFISSNRQWGTTVRVPERYPLTTVFYRNLIGCPDDTDILTCYRVAQPGTYEGKLGYELVQVFQSDPNLGSLKFNSQFAEEAFTVYDHPKVLIFKKTATYNAEQVHSILEAVDLSTVIHVTPRQAGKNIKTLMLPTDRLTGQQSGGTWSSLFQRNALQNKYPWVGAVLWYLTIMVLGWLTYPLVRLAFPGLADRGYPMVRMVGMALLAYLVWMAGSAGIAFNRLTISLALLLIALVGSLLAVKQWDDLKQDWRQNWRYYLLVEGVALLFFALDLGIRLGNPDLWHPYKGGEKPMDFSYFNAVLKSTTFPAYDPWYGGGYLNYYYYGFVISGTLVKWLGIIPSVAYNLILPTWFSMLALGAFSLGWNIISATNKKAEGDHAHPWKELLESRALGIGLAAAIGMLIIGNLGTVRMIWHGIMQLAAPGGVIDGGNFFQQIAWTFKGLAQYLAGAALPYPQGEWYWIPSRAIPGDVITEFPFFTFLYGDPHAHMFALPLTVVALSWAVSVMLSKGKWGESDGRNKWLSLGISFFVGGLIIGALKPTNTWDFPSYLTLACAALVYSLARYGEGLSIPHFQLSQTVRRWISAGAAAIGLLVLSLVLYAPYSAWNAQSYNSFQYWSGARTPFWSYMTHWGLFLFVIVTWMLRETRNWLAATPVSALNKLRPYQSWIQAGLVVLIGAIIMLLLMGVTIAWLVLPLMVWAAILVVRPNISEAKRTVLFLTGVGLTVTLVVEVITLKGDMGRMNMVFKFYMQVWVMFAVCAAAALGWLLADLPYWRYRSRWIWETVFAVLVGGVLLFPLLGGLDKIQDRMAANAPHTLDGMAYMEYAVYNDQGINYDLNQDYKAIQWMQDHVKGSPVIVEQNVTEYRWGNRFTVYTGLPGVVGWNWHQRQQRASLPEEWVTGRVIEVNNFYATTDIQEAVDFLNKYNVSYIIVGQEEEAVTPADGLKKFTEYNGKYWNQVYQDRNTTIYEVCHCTDPE
jgi:YYY domain-containing protein